MTQEHRFLRVQQTDPAVASPRGGAGGREYATLVVAAADTHASAKVTADYVCDGTADDVEIRTALNLLAHGSAFREGGRVVLLEGTYNIINQMFVPSNVVLEGQGYGSVVRIADGANPGEVFAANDTIPGNVSIRRLRINGNRDNAGGPGGAGGGNAGIWLAFCDGAVIEDVVIEDITGLPLLLESCQHSRFSGIHVLNSDSEVHISNCYWSVISDWYLYKVPFFYVNACVYSVCHNIDVELATDFAGVIAENNYACAFSDIRVWGGYDHGYSERDVLCAHTKITSYDNAANGIDDLAGFACVLAACNSWNNEGFGLELAASEDVLVVDSTFTENQFYQMHFTNADRCVAQGNMCRIEGTTNTTYYGVEITATTDGLFLTNNDLKDSGAIGSLNNSGVGTVTAAGNVT